MTRLGSTYTVSMSCVLIDSVVDEYLRCIIWQYGRISVLWPVMKGNTGQDRTRRCEHDVGSIPLFDWSGCMDSFLFIIIFCWSCTGNEECTAKYTIMELMCCVVL